MRWIRYCFSVRIRRGGERLHRNWYHLLDICAVTQTLIGDAEALYDPCVYNDRLLLGLKGTMSEAELYVMKQRLVAAVRSKAERGEFRFSLPPGYYWDEAGRIQKSPDEQIRTTIELIFARFEQFGTINPREVHPERGPPCSRDWCYVPAAGG